MQENKIATRQEQEPDKPYLIDFEIFGSDVDGQLISTQNAKKIPFAINRVFWVKNVPEGCVRGNHAHQTSQEVVVALQGEVFITTETKNGQENFTLRDCNTGLYIPARCWVTLMPSTNALLLCLVSTDYDNKDYISGYDSFKQVISP